MLSAVMIRVLTAMSERLVSWFAQIPGHANESDQQKSALLETAEMLRNLIQFPPELCYSEPAKISCHPQRVREHLFVVC